jgi:CxxC motif-containing protein (DUF1111 family)
MYLKEIWISIIAFLLLAVMVFSCQELIPSTPANNSLLDGPLENLTYSQSRQHLAGDAAFNNQIFTAETGLGSIFVANSCGSCHAGDGKGHPFTTLTRFGQIDETGNKFLNEGGPQLQHRALPGFTPEQIPAGATFSKFTPPANTGLGFIELVSDADILAMADPDDEDGDGISGVPNWNSVPTYVTFNYDAVSNNGKYICRFGKKGSVCNLLQQTSRAYNQDIGITSIFEPFDVYSNKEIDSEISIKVVQDVVFYLQTLKAPIQRNANDPEIVKGLNHFKQIGCEKCHRQTLHSGTSEISALSDKDFHPYTDLLLHDMGNGLDDGYTEGSAKTYEWRTPALWGLGLSPNSQGGEYYLLHDGRAKSIEEAILLHGGEASTIVDKYKELTAAQQQSLISFLKSL